MSDLRKTLPPSVGSSIGIGTILLSCESEIQRVEEEARADSCRAAVSAADARGVMLWEKELGLDLREDLPTEARRSLILAALGELDGCTRDSLCAFISRMIGGEVTLQEQFSSYHVDIGVQAQHFEVPRISTVERAIRRVLPAHLSADLTVRADVQTEQRPERALLQGIKLNLYTNEEEKA